MAFIQKTIPKLQASIFSGCIAWLLILLENLQEPFYQFKQKQKIHQRAKELRKKESSCMFSLACKGYGMSKKRKQMRIMWCQRDPSSFTWEMWCWQSFVSSTWPLQLKALACSVCSANLQLFFLARQLKKIAKSKGFRFVQFDSEESAMTARPAHHDAYFFGKKL